MGPFFSLSVYSGLDVKLIKSDVNKAVVFGYHKDNVILTLKRNTLIIKLSTNLSVSWIEFFKELIFLKIFIINNYSFI